MKAALSACSDPCNPNQQSTLAELQKRLDACGVNAIPGRYLYRRENGSFPTGKEKAEELMAFYQNDDITAIYDVSGGDLANTVLPYLDYKTIASSDITFWGYSDLTAILNAIYTKTRKASVLYQIRNIVLEQERSQTRLFKEWINGTSADLFAFETKILRGSAFEGVVVGGNIRCFLKLAGTEYWPDLSNKILLLESWSGTPAKMMTYLAQLLQLDAFEKINGILLGTFTEMEGKHYMPSMEEMVLSMVPASVPVAKTSEIGHGTDAKAIMIGKHIAIK